MMLDYDDEIMKDDDWLYEEEKPKSKGGFKPIGKMQPPEWTKKGCEVVEDEEAKKRLREELEKKEKKKQMNREYQKRWYEKKKAEKEAAKNAEKKEQPKKTFADVAAELEQMETPVEKTNVDESLDRLAKLREMAQPPVQEPEKPEELTEIVAEPEKVTEIVSEAVDPVPDQEVVVAEIAPTMAADITLVLTTSEAESLYEFIKDELLTVVKRDDIEELDWLADMCSIYKCLRGELIRVA